MFTPEPMAHSRSMNEGLNYNYESGKFARIQLQWDNATRTLKIGKRRSTFPGMLAEPTFEIILVSKARPIGFSFATRSDRIIRYRGEEMEVSF